MVYSEKIKTGIKDIETGNLIGNKAILGYLENVACHHADSIGYGTNTIDQTHSTWLLIDWKLQVIKRPVYGQTLTVSTWSKSIVKCYGNRDFEIRDENDNLCVAVASRWLLIDSDLRKIKKADEKMIASYASEPEKLALENEEIEKMRAPEKFNSSMLYKVMRRDIDMNGHMHNLYYLDLAYEALPEEVYNERLFNNVRITYRKEIKLGEVVNCKYAFEDGKHTVVIESQDGTIIHAIIELK